MAKTMKGTGIFAELSQPAQRALANAGIHDLQQLAHYTEKALLKLHGLGKASLPPLRELLKAENLSFQTENS